jgi:hypothetical protein
VVLTTNGCALGIRVASTTRNEDVVVESKPVSQPTGETVYSAALSADAGRPVTVSAFQQDLCELSEHQVINRTIVTKTEPAGIKLSSVAALLGVATMAGGTVLGVQGLKDDDPKKMTLQGGVVVFALGSILAGGYAYQQLMSGESRRFLGKQENKVAQGRKPCGTQLPASQLEVKLVNNDKRGEILTRTDEQGHAAIPEAEVPKLDAPVSLYVKGSYVGISDAAVARGRAAVIAGHEKACQGGDAHRCNSLGFSYMEGQGVAKDERRGAELFEKACQGRAAEGCFNLGLSYDEGTGVPQDARLASKAYEKACGGGSAMGCVNLGVRYLEGKGVPQDARRAVPLFEKACAAGTGLGCLNLAKRYGRGDGVPKDESRAAALFEQSCELGSAEGCFMLGGCYMQGHGVPKDESRVPPLFAKGCEGGDAASCHLLGMAYEQGAFGLPRDRARAEELKARAATLGYRAE